ncbi:MAG: glycosyltransferase family protein [Thermoflexales bacterium]|nr:glycosyltransferase family protein [Thermoflexales bacterium]
MKSAILITARLKSTRLPMKVIKPIQGRPMIGHMLDRLKLARRPSEIIICTSPLTQDDPLVEIAHQEGVQCYRGDPDDVLLRLTKAAEQFGVDVVISCTADNPFVDPESIDRLVDYHLEQGFDFTRMEGLPFGTFSYAISYPAMVKACELKAEKDTEVWGGYFTETGQFKWGVMPLDDPALRWPKLRLTVDTPEDFELVSRIFDELYEGGHVFPLRDIVALCRRRPDLVAINASVQQKAGLAIKTKLERTDA